MGAMESRLDLFLGGGRVIDPASGLTASPIAAASRRSSLSYREAATK
jgi:hypothetical protein